MAQCEVMGAQMTAIARHSILASSFMPLLEAQSGPAFKFCRRALCWRADRPRPQPGRRLRAWETGAAAGLGG
jgi:hypothetical protein